MDEFEIQMLYEAYESYEKLDEMICEAKLDIFNSLENLTVLKVFQDNLKFNLELQRFKREADNFQEFLNEVLEHLSNEIDPVVEAIEDLENNEDDDNEE